MRTGYEIQHIKQTQRKMVFDNKKNCKKNV